jgi:hypothetical protein
MRLPVLLSLCLLAGCAGMNAAADPASQAAPVVAGYVTDMAAFEAFIATRPTPEQFRARYPDVLLVLPGQIATKELRLNNSRYFAELDGEGRITGGRFS